MEPEDLLDLEAVETDPDSAEQPGEMTEERLKGILQHAVEDAVDFVDNYLAPDREKATAYYRGDPLGNEEEGRSQIVMTEVRDTVQTIMPELMRIFCQQEAAVSFMPSTMADVQEAEQKTDTVNYLFMQDNNGAKLLHDAFLDALVRKSGIFKWYVEDIEDVSEEEYSGLSPDQYMNLMSDDQIDEELSYFEQMDPETGEVTIDVRVRRVNTDRKYRVEVIPPEEFYYARNTRDLDTCWLAGHRRLMTLSELVSMGYDEDDIREHGGAPQAFTTNQEAQVRNPALHSRQEQTGNVDPAMVQYDYFESYIRIDYDQDGVVELRKICSIGAGHYILDNEVVPEIPFAVLCPVPEPHKLIGQSVADLVSDLQKIKTAVVRNTLDSLAQSINPRTAVLEGAVNLDDAMNTENGAIVRVRQIGAIQPLAQPFVGQYALPMMQYLDDIKASRTGVSKASQGLDPDVLQSTTKDAVKNTIMAAQGRIELIARIFAETGLTRLFRGLLRMVSRAQDKPMTLKLRGKWVEVDPQSWDVNCRMVVNVGLGSGQKDEKLATLAGIAMKQEQAIQLLGPFNMLTDIGKYRNTLAKMVELSGYKDTSEFFNEITDEQIQQTKQQMAQQPPKKSSEEILAEIEQMKVQAKQQSDAARNQLDAMKLKMDDDRERDNNTATAMLKAAELEMKYGQPVNFEAILAEMNRNRGNMNGA